MRIGIYGGSFNPPHLGHFVAAVYAAKTLGLEKLFFIPAGIPPHKKLADGSPENAQRLAMVRAMAEATGYECGIDASALDIEMTREGKSYTVDTLRALRAQHPDDELWLLMGTDMFLSFQNWYCPGDILAMAGLCAFGRSETDGEALFAPQRAFLQQRFPGCRITTLVVPGLVDISSTKLREALPYGGYDCYLLPQVYGYILREKLYGTNFDLTRLSERELRIVAQSFLKAKRIPHVLGTEKTAAALAEKYGADVHKARVAALLHDCTKRLTLDEQLSLAVQYNVALDEVERVTLKLTHAKTGAALARALFGVDDEVYGAILWHTTGRPDMTLLEKILYLADYIEPTRDFPGVDALREAVWRDLDEGLRMGLSMTVDEMNELGAPIHENTLSALRFLRGNMDESDT